MQKSPRHKVRAQTNIGLIFVALVVAANGVFVLALALQVLIESRHQARISDASVDVHLLIGLTLLYLSVLLRRAKRTAWVVTLAAYAFYLGLSVSDLLNSFAMSHLHVAELFRNIVVPGAVVFLLVGLRRDFIVRSDTPGFRVAARISLLILLVAFFYGVSGFLLMDRSDFHQEISISTAVHNTVDQFDLTNNQPLQPHTKRAHIFVDSLSFISIGAVAYALVSLFQPLRARFIDQTVNRERMLALLQQSQASSEDFFKIWPHDKNYFFNQKLDSGLAMHVNRGIALCVADPIGAVPSFSQLIGEFSEVCYANDWTPAFIHIENKHRALYESYDFNLQKIGQEAIVHIDHFQDAIVSEKYFRQVKNKFVKQDFTTELLSPPHHQAVIARLKVISDEWLDRPGRVERGFIMGYFSDDYLQQCDLMIVRDGAGTIQAFLNKVPADYDKNEATYDLLRHGKNSLGNINDFLLMNFITEMQKQGYKTVNLGLCPLGGMADIDEDKKTVLDNVLRFAYANGDRFYSFSGLYKFKAKYEPEWRDRYIAYQNGIRGFTRTMNALNRAMRVRSRN